MKNLAVLAFGVTLLFPSITSAAGLSTSQAESILMLLQAFGVDQSTITTVRGILEPVAVIGGTTTTTVTSGTSQQNWVVTAQPQVLGAATPIPQPAPVQPSTPAPAPVPVVIQPIPQGVTEQVGYNIEYEKRVIRDVTTEANDKCANGKTDSTCTFLYKEISDFQDLLNLVQSQYSVHRTEECDNKLSAVYNNIEQVIAGFTIRSIELIQSPHTALYAQGTQTKLNSDYQSQMNQYLPQATTVASTCFGV